MAKIKRDRIIIMKDVEKKYKEPNKTEEETNINVLYNENKLIPLHRFLKQRLWLFSDCLEKKRKKH